MQLVMTKHAACRAINRGADPKRLEERLLRALPQIADRRGSVEVPLGLHSAVLNITEDVVTVITVKFNAALKPPCKRKPKVTRDIRRLYRR